MITLPRTALFAKGPFRRVPAATIASVGFAWKVNKATGENEVSHPQVSYVTNGREYSVRALQTVADRVKKPTGPSPMGLPYRVDRRFLIRLAKDGGADLITGIDLYPYFVDEGGTFGAVHVDQLEMNPANRELSPRSTVALTILSPETGEVEFTHVPARVKGDDLLGILRAIDKLDKISLGDELATINGVTYTVAVERGYALELSMKRTDE